jgi:hypothetical protein
VGGSASASILPSPSLTFTDVRVGPEGAPPMMTVDRFEVTIELMPLLSGEIHVTTMRLERPTVRVAVAPDGSVDWFARPSASDSLNPDKVTLAGVSVSDGSILYDDARNAVSLGFEGINATVEARSLAGPWRAEGSYRSGDTVVPFLLTTGRQLEDGTIRLKTDVSPAEWPVVVSADGVIDRGLTGGMSYAGTYLVTELVENVTGEAVPEGAETAGVGWRSEGTFSLTRDQLSIENAVLSHGPPDRPTSVAGAMTLQLGAEPSFAVAAEARQLDLDRALGGGPSNPVEVAAAAENLVQWLRTLPVPGIPGRITMDVPAIVVGGSVIQDVAFSATPATDGWQVEGFRARVPGQATVIADGVLKTRNAASFTGNARLAVLQPAAFASWWRGSANRGAGRLLSAFDIAGSVTVAPGRFSVDEIDARIGDATIRGRFAWSESGRDGARHLGTDIEADRMDFAQVKALAELLAGRDLTDGSILADSYSVILAAEIFDFDDISMSEVAINAEYSDDVLKIVRFSIGDLGGSSFRVTSGRIDEPTRNPRGELTAELSVDSVDGLALVVGRILPDSGLFEWLGRTADVTTPAFVRARIVAPPVPGGTGFRIAIEDGVAGSSTFDVAVESGTSLLADWRSAAANATAVVASPDSGALARQLGFSASSASDDSGAHVEVRATGIPAEGMDASMIADFAGVTASAAGDLSIAEDLSAEFTGDFGVTASSLEAMMATAGVSIPGAADTPVEVDGTLGLSDGKASLAWTNGAIAGRAVTGNIEVGRRDDSWRLDGDLSVDEVDLGWLLALGLGHSPLPTGDTSPPWSKDSFLPLGLANVGGALDIAAERVAVGGTHSLSGAELSLVLQPPRIDLNLNRAHLAGGAAAGGVSIQNVDGNARVTGQFTLTGASAEAFAWQLDERSVATGIVDLSVNLEAIGRSPAGLISGLTGGGVVTLHDGEARYIDPTFAARQIIRASDLGQEFTDDALRIAVAEQIGADSLAFKETGGAFTVAGGAVRLRGLSLAAADRVEAVGNAVVDLNTMTIDSDWTLTFDPGDTKVEGIDPKIGIVFRGPLASPERIIDALPFGSYLNTRREARILEIIAREEADRLEREWFARVALKLRQETERAARLAQEAAEAERLRREMEAAAGARLEQFHVERELRWEERLADELAQWGEKVAAAREVALEAARVSADLATSARERAAGLLDGIAPLEAADREAASALATAETDYTAAEARLAEARDVAAATDGELADAERALALATAAEQSAMQSSTAAGEAQASAAAALASATSTANAARARADEAESGSVETANNLAEAGQALAEARRIQAAAAEGFTAAQADLDEVETDAQASGERKAAVAREATLAIAERDRLQEEALAAAEAARAAAAARDEAASALADTESRLIVAQDALAKTVSFIENQAAMAEAFPGDALAEKAADTARDLELHRAAQQAEVDDLRRQVAVARQAFEAAAPLAETEAERASMANEAFHAATAEADEAERAAQQAVGANATLLNLISQRTDARDQARNAAARGDAEVQAAAAAFNAAEAEAKDAAEAAQAALLEAEAAEAARARAEAAMEEATAQLAAREEEAVAAADARAAAAARIEALRASAADASAAADAAEAALAEARVALDAATTAATAARSQLEAARTEAASAEANAAEAEAAAAQAARAAEARTIEAELAGYRTTSNGPIEEAVAEPPALRPSRQPINLVPETLVGDQPMVLVPAQ